MIRNLGTISPRDFLRGGVVPFHVGMLSLSSRTTLCQLPGRYILSKHWVSCVGNGPFPSGVLPSRRNGNPNGAETYFCETFADPEDFVTSQCVCWDSVGSATRPPQLLRSGTTKAAGTITLPIGNHQKPGKPVESGAFLSRPC